MNPGSTRTATDGLAVSLAGLESKLLDWDESWIDWNKSWLGWDESLTCWGKSCTCWDKSWTGWDKSWLGWGKSLTGWEVQQAGGVVQSCRVLFPARNKAAQRWIAVAKSVIPLAEATTVSLHHECGAVSIFAKAGAVRAGVAIARSQFVPHGARETDALLSAAIPARAQFRCLHVGWQMAAVRPRPSPLRLGEGAGSPARRQTERFLSAGRGRSFSRSRRERAGVRENAAITPVRRRSLCNRPSPCKQLRCALPAQPFATTDTSY